MLLWMLGWVEERRRRGVMAVLRAAVNDDQAVEEMREASIGR